MVVKSMQCSLLCVSDCASYLIFFHSESVWIVSCPDLDSSPLQGVEPRFGHTLVTVFHMKRVHLNNFMFLYCKCKQIIYIIRNENDG